MGLYPRLVTYQIETLLLRKCLLPRWMHFRGNKIKLQIKIADKDKLGKLQFGTDVIVSADKTISCLFDASSAAFYFVFFYELGGGAKF